MGHAFTPGLKVSEKMLLRKERRLPLKGRVTVKVGDRVKAEDIVAKTELPGTPHMVNAANKLSVQPSELPGIMLKKEGDRVTEKELMAQTKGLFGLLKTYLYSPVNGTIESISTVTGQVFVRENPIPVQINAYIDGEIVETDADETVVVQAPATFIQGIFGIGGETIGDLMVVSRTPDEVLDGGNITPEMKGKIIVGGSLATSDAIKKAISYGVKGVIAGGINDWDIREFLGYDIGVAITGSEEIGCTILVTEGFGRIKMAARTFELFKERQGMKTSINGATQIRAGVMRPEVVIPLPQGNVQDFQKNAKSGEDTEGILNIGSHIRIIRQPYFGKLGMVSGLPVQLQVLETESKARVLEVTLENGEKIVLPRANIEMIEK